MLAWNGHLASLLGYVKLPSWHHRCEDVEVINLSDGGTVSLEWGAHPADGNPIILMLPGINNEASAIFSQPHAHLPTEVDSHEAVSTLRLYVSCLLVPTS
jgi:hypothetical protein